MQVSELTRTRKYKVTPEPNTTPFVRVVDDATVRFSRPYERVELDHEPGPDPVRVDLDLSQVRPIEDETLPFALDDVPTFASEPSTPYDLIEVRLSVPAVAEPLVLRPAPPPAPGRLRVIFLVAVVMIAAFACGMGVVLAVGA